LLAQTFSRFAGAHFFTSSLRARGSGEQRATSAFITVIHADLPFWIPYLSLNVHNIERGKGNAVVLLGREYRRWKASYSKNRSTSWSVSPPRD